MKLRGAAQIACLVLVAGGSALGAGQARPETDPNQQAVVKTSAGTFVLSFYPDKAPARLGGRAQAS